MFFLHISNCLMQQCGESEATDDTSSKALRRQALVGPVYLAFPASLPTSHFFLLSPNGFTCCACCSGYQCLLLSPSLPTLLQAPALQLSCFWSCWSWLSTASCCHLVRRDGDLETKGTKWKKLLVFPLWPLHFCQLTQAQWFHWLGENASHHSGSRALSLGPG